MDRPTMVIAGAVSFLMLVLSLKTLSTLALLATAGSCLAPMAWLCRAILRQTSNVERALGVGIVGAAHLALLAAGLTRPWVMAAWVAGMSLCTMAMVAALWWRQSKRHIP